MLPQNNNRRIPMTVVPDKGDDLMGEAISRCMSRLINAIQAADVPKAVEAWEDLCALKDVE